MYKIFIFILIFIPLSCFKLSAICLYKSNYINSLSPTEERLLKAELFKYNQLGFVRMVDSIENCSRILTISSPYRNIVNISFISNGNLVNTKSFLLEGIHDSKDKVELFKNYISQVVIGVSARNEPSKLVNSIQNIRKPVKIESKTKVNPKLVKDEKGGESKPVKDEKEVKPKPAKVDILQSLSFVPFKDKATFDEAKVVSTFTYPARRLNGSEYYTKNGEFNAVRALNKNILLLNTDNSTYICNIKNIIPDAIMPCVAYKPIDLKSVYGFQTVSSEYGNAVYIYLGQGKFLLFSLDSKKAFFINTPSALEASNALFWKSTKKYSISGLKNDDKNALQIFDSYSDMLLVFNKKRTVSRYSVKYSNRGITAKFIDNIVLTSSLRGCKASTQCSAVRLTNNLMFITKRGRTNMFIFKTKKLYPSNQYIIRVVKK